MYHITKTSKSPEKGRWVLLEHIPTILSPRILLLVFLYAMAFTLLLVGLKMLHLEHRINNVSTNLTSTSNNFSSDNALLYQQESTEEIQQNIASQIIRLHVIANSDSKEDQSLKLEVRDSIIQNLQNTLKNSPSVSAARNILISQIPEIQKTAEIIIKREGYDYPVTVSLNKRYFPVKVYGDLTFPAGDYEALCVEIGTASGQNWWCVLFPSLCFVDETYAVVPDESKEKLQDSLTEEEYKALDNSASNKTDDKKTEKKSKESNTEFHSAIYDWITSR